MEKDVQLLNNADLEKVAGGIDTGHGERYKCKCGNFQIVIDEYEDGFWADYIRDAFFAHVKSCETVKGMTEKYTVEEY